MAEPTFQSSPGTPLPLGPHFSRSTINFALFSKHAKSVVLVFYFADETNPDERIESPLHEIRLDPETNRTGDIWHIGLHTSSKPVHYGFRLNGREDASKGLFFFPDVIVIDPYCKRLLARPWGEVSSAGQAPICIAAAPDPFDWQDDRPLQIPTNKTIIYEMHVRGYTRHQSSGVSSPGTFRSIIEKIDHLKTLGITAVELLPVTEWDETDCKYRNPDSGEKLLNYWGYNPLSFFALRSGLAAQTDKVLNEFRHMVRSFHQAGIEVLLDLVFNHSGESDYAGITSSLRAIDNPIYYLVDENQNDYRNYSGCGNTVNCNHPVVRYMIIDALRYFVTELHVDGFRFDLAAIFSRGSDGEPLADPPLIDLIAEDPILQNSKIIAEAWDAVGLYQVGSFSTNKRWMEWNGRFRDDVRRFMAGHDDTVRNLATRIAGSSDLYQEEGRGPLNSINFITSHDGFTLYDLVSYNDKKNMTNGEQNRDGDNHNLSWNSGYEGSPCPPEVAQFRYCRMKTFAAILLFSQGIPMITAGDEFGRSQLGNNNSWCQDSDISWLNWELVETNNGLLRFFQKCIALRKRYEIFRRNNFFSEPDVIDSSSTREISWQSLTPGSQDWSASCHVLSFFLYGSEEQARENTSFFIMLNGDTSETKNFTLPSDPDMNRTHDWNLIIDTAAASPHDIVDSNEARRITPGSTISVQPMALVMLQSIDPTLPENT